LWSVKGFGERIRRLFWIRHDIALLVGHNHLKLGRE